MPPATSLTDGVMRQEPAAGWCRSTSRSWVAWKTSPEASMSSPSRSNQYGKWTITSFVGLLRVIFHHFPTKCVVFHSLPFSKSLSLSISPSWLVITHSSSSVHPPFQPTQPLEPPRGTKKSADRRWVRSTMRFLANFCWMVALGTTNSQPLFQDGWFIVGLPIKNGAFPWVFWYVYQRIHEFLRKSRLETSIFDQLWLAERMMLRYVAIWSPYSVMGPCNDFRWALKEWDASSQHITRWYPALINGSSGSSCVMHLYVSLSTHIYIIYI